MDFVSVLLEEVATVADDCGVVIPSPSSPFLSPVHPPSSSLPWPSSLPLLLLLLSVTTGCTFGWRPGLCFTDSLRCATISTTGGACSRTCLACKRVIPTRHSAPTITSWSPFANRPQEKAGEPKAMDWMKTYCRGESLPPSMISPSGELPNRWSCANREEKGLKQCIHDVTPQLPIQGLPWQQERQHTLPWKPSELPTYYRHDILR